MADVASRWFVRVLAVVALLVIGYTALAASATGDTEGAQAAARDYGYPYATAPDCAEVGSNRGCLPDAWDMTQGQCTSWVAFRLNGKLGVPFDSEYRGRRWGHARDWGATARAAGLRVDDRPAVGSVAWFEGSDADSLGHVGYVEEVRWNGEVVMSEMNFDSHNGFRLRTLARGDGWPSGFIHFAG